MHILLTGARGMVGRNLLEHPGIKKFRVTSPSRDELDLRDARLVERFVNHARPDLVIHAAGKVGGIQANILEPSSFMLENIQIGCNIVNASRKYGVRRLINLGSSCMYPKGHYNSLGEELLLSGALEPTNEGYALAKIAVSKLCEYISHENSEYQYKTLLPCNLYGKYDKFEPKNSHLVPSIIRKIHSAKANREKTVEIWGDGTARREFMYAGDLADAIVATIDRFEEAPTTMNIGLGYDYSVNEYYQNIANVIGFQGSFSHNLAKPVGMKRKLLNISRQTNWGWSPKVGLAEGIRKTYTFFLENIQK